MEGRFVLDSGAVHAVLDFDRPIAVLMVAVLHFVSDAEDAHAVAAQFVDAIAPGSALVVSHASEGHEAGKFGAAREGWNNATSQLVLRDRREVEAFFAGTELMDPGVVIIPAWRPDRELSAEDLELDYGHAGVGIKR